MTETLTREEEELLLNRPVEDLVTAGDRLEFAGRVCAITGAGGSVGGELARQIAACDPAGVVLVDHSEHALFRIERELAERRPPFPIEAVLCDVTRAAAIRRALCHRRPSVVFHAAAYKHVTMAERAICATARVNILGTVATLAATRDVGAQFVLISSDKAAAPCSVMGATKRFAEFVVMARGPGFERHAVVRFGNVLASSGSFVEIAREQIRTRRPIVVTDPRATRFFMSLSEAATLVMKASTIAKGGETFFLDMGAPVSIGEMTDRLLRAATSHGLPPIPIEIVGLRSGEKLAEQLTSQGIGMRPTEHRRICAALQPAVSPSVATTLLPALHAAMAREDATGVLEILTDAIPDFVPSAEAWNQARTAVLSHTESGTAQDGSLRAPVSSRRTARRDASIPSLRGAADG